MQLKHLDCLKLVFLKIQNMRLRWVSVHKSDHIYGIIEGVWWLVAILQRLLHRLHIGIVT